MRRHTLCAALAAVALVVVPGHAAAFDGDDPQEIPGPSPTTTAPPAPGPSPTTTAPPAPGPSTTTTAPPAPGPSTTTTTTAPPGASFDRPDQLPPLELPEDLPEVPFDAGDHHGRQGPPPKGPWDDHPVGNAKLAALNTERADAIATLKVARAAVADAEAGLAAARAQLAELTEAEAAASERHGETRARFQRRVAAAYVVGSGPAVRFPAEVDVPAEADRVVLPGAVSEADRKLAERYRAEHAALSSKARKAAEEVTAAELRLETAQRAVTAGEERLASIDAALEETPESIAGFVFPVAGPHHFISSFGFCRDGCRRAHQGNDLFAARGTPVVAVEDGWVERIGTNRLGGLVVWTRGRSGYRYYYAHLDSYAPGLREGQEVTAGTHLGGVGDTGNAKGTPPHLHFEIHPGYGPAIDPYPILASAPVLSAPAGSGD